jgi:hypothetical protein
MGVVESLAAWGVPRAAEVVELANVAGLDLAAAATCLEMESGGRNVWGSDAVQTGGAYVKGAEVTREAYLAYRALQDAGQIDAQGVGPTQLTYPPLQRAADQVGGCWDWRANVLTGFRHLAQLQRAYGRAEGFRRYNGSGPMAEKYKAKAEAAYARWRTRLGATTTTTPTTPGRDWFDMATEADLRRIVEEVVDARLDLLVSQIMGPWPSWGGGTDETLTLVDYARRTNVEVRQAWNAINGTRAETAAAVSGMSKQVGELAAEVRDLSSTSTGVNGTLPAEFEITGTARPVTT